MMLILLPIFSHAWATTDLSAIGSPVVTISPASGPPGTKITITVTNIPDISKESYPYADLYLYLPFSQSFGTTVQSQCSGEDCFPIYTHDDALNHDFADRTITLTTFSTNNPLPVYFNGFENSVCDVIVNSKTVERYSTLCNTKDQPTGTYEIKLAWGLENYPQQSYTVKTVEFAVTPGSPLTPPPVADNGNSIITAYQNGQISEQQFETELKAFGWNNEQIHQALAVIGKLPHQMGAPVPDEVQQIQQGVEKTAVQPTSQSAEQTTMTTGQSVPATSQYQIHQEQPSSEVQTNTGTATQNNSLWYAITILSSIGGAAAIVGSIFVFKHTQKITN